MVNCCVPGCTNYSSKTSDVSYHKMPKDLKLQEAWISRIRRDNMPPLQNCYVCSELFTEECFERDLFQQLTGEKRKRKLKSDAIPTVFSFASSSVSGKRRATSENRIKRQRQQEVMEDLLAQQVCEEVMEVDSNNDNGKEALFI
ncbi:THAP domain-containing protein 2 [Exaiptasia diaphana]|nr:THAP domain-containing protein 2 [Exaiptasia diaphana]